MVINLPSNLPITYNKILHSHFLKIFKNTIHLERCFQARVTNLCFYVQTQPNVGAVMIHQCMYTRYTYMLIMQSIINYCSTLHVYCLCRSYTMLLILYHLHSRRYKFIYINVHAFTKRTYFPFLYTHSKQRCVHEQKH